MSAFFPSGAQERAAQDAARCQAQVSSDSWHFYQCRNKAVVIRDVNIGSSMIPKIVAVRCCRTHDPEAAAARAKVKPPSKFDRESAAMYRRADAADAMKAALNARDGNTQSLLNNSSFMDAMRSVDSETLWSVLDAKGTQTMMKQVLGEAGSVADFESVRKRLVSSWYSMNFQHGVKFDLTIATGDAFAAATISSLLNAAVIYRKMSGSETEKAALSETDISSSSGKLGIHFSASDNDFSNLLKSQLFQSMVR